MQKSLSKIFNEREYGGRVRYSKNDALRVSVVLDLIGSKRHVLDVGCEDGVIALQIKNQGNLVSGIEIAGSASKIAKTKGIKVYNFDLEEKVWPEVLNNRFDFVFAGEVIEHIYDTENFLKNISKTLKEQGKLIVTTPNIASLGRRIMLLLGKNPLIETSLSETNAGHIRYFTFSSLQDLLERNGFKVVFSRSIMVNFDINGRMSSKIAADIFPTLGSTIIMSAIKLN